ncbi:hypothetical protein BU26DRAFT_267763 [Trematosphaeria pertusa]|uniref:Uncharacterized protein n=1 Tax=Trematosphaeria pertusa TaxID=390896 RepID=A0A6A6IKC0_9PLEO|nr:uncharacterized protein BU26DRAFT_267763 [Trematosphaeria pertusa]KAF2250637.1 hypothetical protein BU26DRAFT_267763 [Trematosphaeria pertusa]
MGYGNGWSYWEHERSSRLELNDDALRWEVLLVAGYPLLLLGLRGLLTQTCWRSNRGFLVHLIAFFNRVLHRSSAAW